MAFERWIVALGVAPTLLLFLGCLNTDNGLVVVDGKVEFLVVEADGGG